MTDRHQGQPDQKMLSGSEVAPNRKVLFAVELIDPIAQSQVYRGVKVAAAGLISSPILNKSGRFVWLEEGDRWPGVISVTPEGAPFAKQIASAPSRPADLAKVKPDERLVRITLRPTCAYPLEDGVTAIRGRLRETDEEDSPPIPGARVQLAWHDLHSDTWVPATPPDDRTGDGDGERPSPREPETDEHGQFVVFLRLNPPTLAEPDFKNGLLAIRLQFTDPNSAETRHTPDDFPFLAVSDAIGEHLPAGDDAAPNTNGRIQEGRLLARDVTIAWAKLNPL